MIAQLQQFANVKVLQALGLDLCPFSTFENVLVESVSRLMSPISCETSFDVVKIAIGLITLGLTSSDFASVIVCFSKAPDPVLFPPIFPCATNLSLSAAIVSFSASDFWFSNTFGVIVFLLMTFGGVIFTTEDDVDFCEEISTLLFPSSCLWRKNGENGLSWLFSRVGAPR